MSGEKGASQAWHSERTAKKFFWVSNRNLLIKPDWSCLRLSFVYPQRMWQVKDAIGCVQSTLFLLIHQVASRFFGRYKKRGTLLSYQQNQKVYFFEVAQDFWNKAKHVEHVSTYYALSRRENGDVGLLSTSANENELCLCKFPTKAKPRSFWKGLQKCGQTHSLGLGLALFRFGPCSRFFPQFMQGNNNIQQQYLCLPATIFFRGETAIALLQYIYYRAFPVSGETDLLYYIRRRPSRLRWSSHFKARIMQQK